MLILGIESSCDETAVALVENGRHVHASLIASQIDVHAKWGGVIPEIAAREHLTSIRHIYAEVLKQANVQESSIDVIAVSQGPGLIGCLMVGASFAKGLAQGLQKPIVPVNHVHAHIHGALLGIDKSIDEIFPTLALVVSGGHTNLYYMNAPTEFELLGHTIDDACGESFDKVGKMLGLPYPGGPHVEALAKRGTFGKFIMPKMMAQKDDLSFSYSGLKTAVALSLKKSGELNVAHEDIARAFQEEALGQIVRKLAFAAKSRPDAKSIIVAGGVAANSRFKELIIDSIKLPTWFPPLKYCSDNGAMIAAMAYYELKAEQKFCSLDWDVFSRYPFEQFLNRSRVSL